MVVMYTKKEIVEGGRTDPILFRQTTSKMQTIPSGASTMGKMNEDV